MASGILKDLLKLVMMGLRNNDVQDRLFDPMEKCFFNKFSLTHNTTPHTTTPPHHTPHTTTPPYHTPHTTYLPPFDNFSLDLGANLLARREWFVVVKLRLPTHFQAFETVICVRIHGTRTVFTVIPV